MLSEVLGDLEKNLKVLSSCAVADDESRCHSVNQALQQVKQEISALRHDEAVLQRYKECVWGRKEGSLMRTALSLLEKKTTVECGAILLQGLLVASESPEILGIDEFRNFIVFATASVEFARDIRISRLAPITKMLRNLVITERFPVQELESKLEALRRTVLRTFGDSVSDSIGIGNLLEVLSLLAVNFRSLFDDESASAAINLIVHRIQVYGEKFKKPPVIEISHIFAALNDLLKHTNAEIRAEQRSLVWLLWKQYFTRETMSVRSVVVANAVLFMREQFRAFAEFIAKDCQSFYNTVLDFAFCSDANKQNRTIERASFDLAVEFVATLPHVLSALRTDRPEQAQQLVKYISDISYQLALKGYRRMCFGVISLASLPPEAFSHLSESGARFSTVRDAVLKFLESYRCASSCRDYCIRARLLLALVEAADSAKNSSFFDLATDLHDDIEDFWLSALLSCDKGVQMNAQLFSRLFSLNSERSRCVKRFLDYLLETGLTSTGIAIWQGTCGDIPSSDDLSQFVSISMAILAKELISCTGSYREAAVALVAGFCGCRSISVQLDQCFFSVIMYFMEDFLRTESLINLSVMASLVGREVGVFRRILRLDSQSQSLLSSTSTPDGDYADALHTFTERILKLTDLLSHMLLRSPSVDTVVEYFPCYSVLPETALDSEERVRTIACLVERCFEVKFDEEMCKIVAKLCGRSARLRQFLRPVILRNRGSSEIPWDLLKTVAGDTSTLTLEVPKTDLPLESSLKIMVGRLEVEVGALLKAFSKCVQSEAMVELFSGFVETTIRNILSTNDSNYDNTLLRDCCEYLATSPNKFIETFEKHGASERFLSITIRSILSLASMRESRRFELVELLRRVITKKESVIEVLAAVLTSDVLEPGLAAELLSIFLPKADRFPSVVLKLLKETAKGPLNQRFINEIDFSTLSLPGIESLARDLLCSDSASLAQMEFAVRLLHRENSLDWIELAHRSSANPQNSIFLLEQAPENAFVHSEVIPLLDGRADIPGWVTVVHKLSKANPTAFEELIRRSTYPSFVDSVFKSANLCSAADVFEAFWNFADEDSKREVRNHIQRHYDVGAFLSQSPGLIDIEEAVKRVKILERLVDKRLWTAPFRLAQVVDRLLECEDIYSQLLANQLWNQMLISSLQWEESVKCVAECAHRLFLAERKDLLPYFMERLKRNAIEFIKAIPARAEHVLLSICEGRELNSELKSAILGFCRKQEDEQLFTRETFRLLRLVGTVPWSDSGLPGALQKVSIRQSMKLKCAFLQLTTLTDVEERFCSKLVTEWIPLEGAEPDELLDAILETEKGFLWKHLLLNVYFVEENPAAVRVSQWLEKNTAGLKNPQPLLDTVVSICIAGDDALPCLPSKSEMRQFKIVENALSRLLDAIPADVLVDYVEKSANIESMINKADAGIKEIAFLSLFIRIFEKTDSETLENFCTRKGGVGSSRQPLKTFLVVRCLQHFKKSSDDGKDPFMKWKFHSRAFSLCAAVLLRSKHGKTRHTYLNNIFSSPAMWDRLAGYASVVGVSFGNNLTGESGIRKRKSSASEEIMDDHDFTSAESTEEEIPSLDSSTRMFSCETHPCLQPLIALANHCLGVPVEPGPEDAPVWLKNLKTHLESDYRNLNTAVFVLWFVQSCGKHFDKHRNELDSVLSSCVATVLRDGASLDCELIREALERCSQIDSKLSQLIFNGIFSSTTNSSRLLHLKAFGRFYNPVNHQINLFSLEDALSPAISWCRYEVFSVFYRNAQNFGVFDITRIDWKNTVEALGDSSGGMSGSYLRKSIARMVASALGMAERTGYSEIAENLKMLITSQLRSCEKSEEGFRLLQTMSEEYPPIVDELMEDVLTGMKSPNCRFHAFRLLKVLVQRHHVDSKTLFSISPSELNAPTRLVLLETVREICQGTLYDSAEKREVLETFLERFAENNPTTEYLRVLIDIHAEQPEMISAHLVRLWPSLNADLKQFLVEEWIEKIEIHIDCLGPSLEPELALRLHVRTADLAELFGGNLDRKDISALFAEFIGEEPQIAIEVLESASSMRDAVIRGCTEIATSEFHPLLAWKLMTSLENTESAFQELMEIYGIPRQCWPLGVFLDGDAIRIAENCLSPEEALRYLRLCSNLSLEMETFLEGTFRGDVEHVSRGECPNLPRSLILLLTENWTPLFSTSVSHLSPVELQILCRAQLENERIDEEFWREISSNPLFEAQVYFLEYKIQSLEVDDAVEEQLRKLKNGLRRVWTEIDEEQRIRLSMHVRAISDVESVIQAVSNENVNTKIHRLCLKWSILSSDRSTVLRRIRLLMGMTKHSECSTKTFAALATVIAKHHIQLLKMDIPLVDPRTNNCVSLLTNSRRIEILSEARRLLPGCEANERGEMISEVHDLAERLL